MGTGRGLLPAVLPVFTRCPLAPPSSLHPPPKAHPPHAGPGQVLGSWCEGTDDEGAAALALFSWNRGALSETHAHDPSLVQSRPLPARRFWRPGGRSSLSGRRGETQACLFLSSGAPESRPQGRWTPSRASQRRGRALPGSLAPRGFSFRGFSILGLSSLCGFSFQGLSFGGFSFFTLSLGPRPARGACSSSAASPDSHSSFSAASPLLGIWTLSSTFQEGSGCLTRGARASGFGCYADKCRVVGSATIPWLKPLPAERSPLRKSLPGVMLAPWVTSLMRPTTQGQVRGLLHPQPQSLGGDKGGCESAWGKSRE